MEEFAFSTRELALMHDVSASIQAFTDLDKLLQFILKKVKATVNIEGASIALHDPQRQEFYFIRTVEAENKSDPANASQMRFPDHFGVAGWVFKNNQTVIIPDVETDDRYSNQLDLQQNFNTRSMICVPLATRKTRIGVIYVLNKIKGRFGEREARLLEILAGPIAISIENARLYAELRQHADDLEAENRRL